MRGCCIEFTSKRALWTQTMQQSQALREDSNLEVVQVAVGPPLRMEISNIYLKAFKPHPAVCHSQWHIRETNTKRKLQSGARSSLSQETKAPLHVRQAPLGSLYASLSLIVRDEMWRQLCLDTWYQTGKRDNCLSLLNCACLYVHMNMWKSGEVGDSRYQVQGSMACFVF